MNIAGVVILYHPNLQQLSENIHSYVSGLKELYVYDNSEEEMVGLAPMLSALHPNIKYHYFHLNQGIAYRLNQAVSESLANGYDYLLTMDQDSSFQPGDFQKMLNQIEEGQFSNVAQFGVNCQPALTQSKEQPESVLTLITSGSILNLSLTQKVGVFNEQLFIDFVDAEFSYRVIQSGYINLMFSNIVLNHKLGELINGRSFKTFKSSLRIIHSPIRVFYMVRNGLYLLYKSNNLTPQMKKDVVRCLGILKNDFIYHPQLASVYLNAFKGAMAFLFNKMGKK